MDGIFVYCNIVGNDKIMGRQIFINRALAKWVLQHAYNEYFAAMQRIRKLFMY